MKQSQSKIKKQKKARRTVADQWYEDYLKHFNKGSVLGENGQDNVRDTEMQKRVGRYARDIVPLTKEELVEEIIARLAGQFAGSKKQSKGRTIAREIGSAQSGTLTRTQALNLKQLAIENKTPGAENWKINEMQRNRAYLHDVYTALQEGENALTPEDAWQKIGLNVFDSEI